jgi:hypothetical protein
MLDLSGRLSFRSSLANSLAAVVGGSGNANDLERTADAAATLPGADSVGDVVWAVGELLRSLAMAIQWEPAIAAAAENPVRFRDAAKYRAEKALASRAQNHWPAELISSATLLAQLAHPNEIVGIADKLRMTPLPTRITDVTAPEPRPKDHPTERSDSTPAVAPILVLLSLDNEPIQSPLVVRPNQLYKLQIATRSSQLPTDADTIAIDFVSVLPASALELQPARISLPETTATTYLQLKGMLPNGLSEEIVLRATYLGEGERLCKADIVGNPRFKVATFDSGSAMPRDLPVVAQKLLAMLHELDAKIPRLLPDDRADFFTLFESLLRFAHRALYDRRLAAQVRIPEADFQRELRAHLQADPSIGARHWEAQRLAGGISDLGLGKIILELKVEHDKPVTPETAAAYMSQPAHYAAGLDRQVSILCILDDSEKTSPPGSLANYMGWLVPSLHGLDDPKYPSMVAVVIIPTRFPVPSGWST